MNHRFVTYFDSHYAAKGIAMVESLLRHYPSVVVTVLCFDDAVRGIVGDWFGGRIETIAQASLEKVEPRLGPLRFSRSAWEFYATHKAVLMKYLVGRCEDGEILTYVDADTLFFSEPGLLFDEFGSASIGLSPHRYSRNMYDMEQYGLYNAGIGMWRNDANGRRCLADWTEQCLEWCEFKTTSDGRFMNQGYLTDWPARYQGVKVLVHPGVNLAPWNVGSHRIVGGRAGVRVDGQPVIFFHFSSLFHSAEGVWQTVYPRRVLNKRVVLQELYRPYLAMLEATSRKLRERYGIDGLESVRTVKAGKVLFDVGRAIDEGSGLWRRILGKGRRRKEEN